MLEGKVILITGSHSGIGFAAAKLCREQGAEVVIHGRDLSQVDQALETLNKGDLGKKAFGVTADLSDPSAPDFLVEKVIEKHGKIDGIVNNAACLDRSTIDASTTDLFDQMMAVNVRAPIMLIKAALPYMEKQGGREDQRMKQGGSIVNIGSINAYCGASNLLLYSTTKAALMTATRNLGDALLSRFVRVNQLNVGWTLTENEHKLQLSEGQPEDWLTHLPESFAPSGSIMRPEEISEHIVFWLSPKSAPVTGQVYEVEQYPLIGRNHISER